MTGSSNWTDIPNNEIDQDSPATETLFTAIRDNINAAQWSYYDDADGLIYDFAVDGIVSNVVSPDFEDGYEYAFMFSADLDGNSPFVMQLYWETDGLYFDYKTLTSGSSTLITSFEIVRLPRLGVGFLPRNGDSGFSSTTSTDKILRARFEPDGSNTIAAGKIWMFRRHVNV